MSVFSVNVLSNQVFADGDEITTALLNKLGVPSVTLNTGTALQVLRTKSDLSGLEWVTVGFVSPADHSWPTDSIPTTVSDTHGLAGVPNSVDWCAVCQSAEFGYSVGDIVPLRQFVDNTNTNHPAFFENRSSTSLIITRVELDTNIRIVDLTNGNHVTPTPAKWKIRVYASCLTA